jgi:hypothetical protein
MYYIYLIYAKTDGIIQWKVGISIHPDQRIKELKTANPNIVGICALYQISNRQIAYKTEMLLKRALKPFKIDGEWVEDIALNQSLFFEYCDKYFEIAKSIVQVNSNLNYDN